jgi:hypothetical protein
MIPIFHANHAKIFFRVFRVVRGFTASLFQTRNRRLHFRKVNVGIARVGNVDDFSVEADEKAHALGHVFSGHPHAVNVRDLAIGIGEQGEVQFVFGDELQMAVGGIKTDADNLDVVRGEILKAVAETARFLRAAAGEILRIKIQQHDFFADEVGEFEILAVLVRAGDERRGVASFWNVSEKCGGGNEQRGEKQFDFHGDNVGNEVTSLKLF